MFKDNLKYFRKRARLTQQELADKIGIARSTIAMYERGEREPDFETLESIADILNINISTLFDEEKEKAPAISDEDLDCLNKLKRLGEADRRYIEGMIDAYLSRH